MKTLPWLFTGLVAGVTGISVLFASPFWYLNILVALLLGGVLYLTRDWPDRVFYSVCASQPLIIACGLMNIWAGLFVVWMAGALTAVQLERLSSRQDLLFLLLFFGSTFLLAGMVQVANHVTPLLALLGAGLALLLLVLVFRDYQFRKHYSGARP